MYEYFNGINTAYVDWNKLYVEFNMKWDKTFSNEKELQQYLDNDNYELQGIN